MRFQKEETGRRPSWRYWDASWISKDAKDQGDTEGLGVREGRLQSKGLVRAGVLEVGPPLPYLPSSSRTQGPWVVKETQCATAIFHILSSFQVCILFSCKLFFLSLCRSGFCWCDLNFSLPFKAFISQVEGRNF